MVVAIDNLQSKLALAMISNGNPHLMMRVSHGKRYGSIEVRKANFPARFVRAYRQRSLRTADVP